MAHMHALAVLFLVLIGLGHAVPVLTTEQLKSSIVRRHHEDSAEVHFGASGEMSLLHREEPCDHDYHLGVNASNSCDEQGASQITDPDECKKAAERLGSAWTIAPTTAFTKDGGSNTDPLPFPKYCFAIGGLVYFNPTAVDQIPTAFTGQPVCDRPLHPIASGTAAAKTCPTGFEPILNFTSCKDALVCVMGGSGCADEPFKDLDEVNYMTGNLPTTRSGEDLPNGCFVEATTGCFSFNPSATGTATGTAAGDASVCRKSTSTR